MSKVEIPEDPVKAALQVMLTFSKAFESIKDECARKLGKGGEEKTELDETVLSRRLEDFPTLMLQVGLIPAITFYISKIDDQKKVKAYEVTLNVIRNPEEKPSVDICHDLSGAGGGYPHATALLLAYAGEISGCSDTSYATTGPDLVECLKKIEEQGMRIEKLTLNYVYELKKLAKALYHEKER